MKDRGAVVVSWDFTHGDGHECLLVGERRGVKSGIDISNAIFGPEARTLLNALFEKQEGENLTDD